MMKLDRKSGYRGALWVLLLMLVAVQVFAVFQHSRNRAADPEKQAEISDSFLIAGRYAIGLSEIARRFDVPDVSSAALEEAAKGMKTPADSIAFVVVAAEVAGPEAALRRIEELRGAAGINDLPGDPLDALAHFYREETSAAPGPEMIQLLNNLGWFGEYILAEPIEKEAKALEAMYKALGILGFAWSGVILGLIGAAFLSIALFNLYRKNVTWRYRVSSGAESGDRVPYFEVLVLAITLLFFAPTILPRTVFSNLVSTTVVLGVVLLWPILRIGNRRQALKGLGWTRGSGVLTEVLWGVAAFVTSIPVLFVGIVLTYHFMRLTGAPEPHHPVVDFIKAAEQPARLIQLIILGAIVAPLVEETLFRGAFYHHLRGKRSPFIAAITTGFIFAVIHPQGWAAAPILTLIGTYWAFLREWRGSLIAPIVAHALNNGVVLLIIVFVI